MIKKKKNAESLECVLMCAGARENWTQIFANFKCGHFNWSLVNWKKKKRKCCKNEKCSQALLFWSFLNWMIPVDFFFWNRLNGNVLCFKASRDTVALSEQHYPFFFPFFFFLCMFPVRGIVQCGAEAHSLRVDKQLGPQRALEKKNYNLIFQ